MPILRRRARKPVEPFHEDEVVAFGSLPRLLIPAGLRIGEARWVEAIERVRVRYLEVRQQLLATWAVDSREARQEGKPYPVPWAVAAFEVKPGTDAGRRAARLGIFVRPEPEPAPGSDRALVLRAQRAARERCGPLATDPEVVVAWLARQRKPEPKIQFGKKRATAGPLDPRGGPAGGNAMANDGKGR